MAFLKKFDIQIFSKDRKTTALVGWLEISKKSRQPVCVLYYNRPP